MKNEGAKVRRRVLDYVPSSYIRRVFALIVCTNSRRMSELRGRERAEGNAYSEAKVEAQKHLTGPDFDWALSTIQRDP